MWGEDEKGKRVVLGEVKKSKCAEANIKHAKEKFQHQNKKVVVISDKSLFRFLHNLPTYIVHDSLNQFFLCYSPQSEASVT